MTMINLLGDKTMSSTNIYHECGYPLIMESVKQGSQFIAEFFDPQIKDHAEKVTVCPCCQQFLGQKPKETMEPLSYFNSSD